MTVDMWYRFALLLAAAAAVSVWAQTTDQPTSAGSSPSSAVVSVTRQATFTPPLTLLIGSSEVGRIVLPYPFPANRRVYRSNGTVAGSVAWDTDGRRTQLTPPPSNVLAGGDLEGAVYGLYDIAVYSVAYIAITRVAVVTGVTVDPISGNVAVTYNVSVSLTVSCDINGGSCPLAFHQEKRLAALGRDVYYMYTHTVELAVRRSSEGGLTLVWSNTDDEFGSIVDAAYTSVTSESVPIVMPESILLGLVIQSGGFFMSFLDSPSQTFANYTDNNGPPYCLGAYVFDFALLNCSYSWEVQVSVEVAPAVAHPVTIVVASNTRTLNITNSFINVGRWSVAISCTLLCPLSPDPKLPPAPTLPPTPAPSIVVSTYGYVTTTVGSVSTTTALTSLPPPPTTNGIRHTPPMNLTTTTTTNRPQTPLPHYTPAMNTTGRSRGK